MQRKKLLDGTITRLEEYLKCTYTLITVGLNTRSSFTKLTLDDDNANNRYRSYHIVTLPPVCLSYNLAYTSGYDNYYVMRTKQVWVMKKKV